MAHQVFVGIAEQVIVFRTVLAEIQRFVLEDGDQIGEPVYLLLPVTQFLGIEVGDIRQLVFFCQRLENFFVDLVADVRLALERDHVLETGTGRDRDFCVWRARIFVADVLDEQHHQHVVLVLAGIHAATQLVAARPKRGIKFGFLDCHVFLSILRCVGDIPKPNRANYAAFWDSI